MSAPGRQPVVGQRRPASLSIAGVLLSAYTALRWYQLADRFRQPSPARARATLQRWCRWACPQLGVHVAVSGAVPELPCLYVANHRSYLDVPVLASVLSASFLSRADVAGWALVGPVARLTDAVLVQRDDPHDRLRAARRLVRRLRSASVVVFPEGTTTGAPLPTPFHPGTFRLVQRLAVPIVPVTLRYSDRRAYWVEDVSAWRHLTTRVLQRPPLHVAVEVGSALFGGDYVGPQQLAAAVYAAVCRPIETRGELA